MRIRIMAFTVIKKSDSRTSKILFSHTNHFNNDALPEKRVCEEGQQC